MIERDIRLLASGEWSPHSKGELLNALSAAVALLDLERARAEKWKAFADYFTERLGHNELDHDLVRDDRRCDLCNKVRELRALLAAENTTARPEGT